MQFEDGQLVSRCIEGQTEAFGKLVDRYERSVYATAYFYVGRYGAAEDVAQEAFLAAYRSLRQLDNPGRFGPWLKEITCRTAANWLRRHTDHVRGETPLPFRHAVSLEDAREGPAALAERTERFKDVQNAIDALPVRYRLPVVLRFLQELSYDEIGRFTGESRHEVRGILQRAARQLRDSLSDKYSSEGNDQWHHART